MTVTFVTSVQDRKDMDEAIEQCDLAEELRDAKRKVWIAIEKSVNKGEPKYVVCDNRDRNAWTEEFNTLDGALMYALDIYTTTEDQESWDYCGALLEHGSLRPWGEPSVEDERKLVSKALARLPKTDLQGGMVLYSRKNRKFYKIAWGTGDNLDDEARKEGFDDYIVGEIWKLEGGVETIGRIVRDLRTKGMGEFFDALGSEVGGVSNGGSDYNYIRREKEHGGETDLRAYIPEELSRLYYTKDEELDDPFDDLVLVSTFK